MIATGDVACELRACELDELRGDPRTAGPLAARLAARRREWRGKRAELVEALQVLRRVELRRAPTGRPEAPAR